MRQVRSTSVEVFKAINEEGLVGELQRKVLEVLSKSDHALTVAEIAAELNTPKNHISGRCSELVNSGLLKECEKRECNITGRRVLSFRELKDGEEVVKRLGKCGIEFAHKSKVFELIWDNKVVLRSTKLREINAEFKKRVLGFYNLEIEV